MYIELVINQILYMYLFEKKLRVQIKGNMVISEMDKQSYHFLTYIKLVINQKTNIMSAVMAR